MGMGREWELYLRHHGNELGNENKLMGKEAIGMLELLLSLILTYIV